MFITSGHYLPSLWNTPFLEAILIINVRKLGTKIAKDLDIMKINGS
jgi:hypothetical protein